MARHFWYLIVQAGILLPHLPRNQQSDLCPFQALSSRPDGTVLRHRFSRWRSLIMIDSIGVQRTAGSNIHMYEYATRPLNQGADHDGSASSGDQSRVICSCISVRRVAESRWEPNELWIWRSSNSSVMATNLTSVASQSSMHQRADLEEYTHADAFSPRLLQEA